MHTQHVKMYDKNFPFDFFDILKYVKYYIQIKGAYARGSQNAILRFRNSIRLWFAYASYAKKYILKCQKIQTNTLHCKSPTNKEFYTMA
jgi:hypothetical protein